MANIQVVVVVEEWGKKLDELVLELAEIKYGLECVIVRYFVYISTTTNF
jgi:nucleoside-diphosphate-sugar epimerase